MKRLAVLAVFLAVPASADRAVETWTGTWSGKATWKGCSVEGPASVAVKVSWRDGAAWIDGAAIYEGLGEIAAENTEQGGLRYSADDMTVTFAKKGKKATLRFETAAKCTMTAKITRIGSGIGACDDLVALGAAATSCKIALDDDPADEVDAWASLRGKARARADKACGKRADTLRATLIAEACIPPEDDPADLPGCREVWKAAERMMRCDRAPAELKQRTMATVADLRRSLRAYAGREGTKELAASTCAEATTMLIERLDVLHCP
jgi:hypothetical protein